MVFSFLCNHISISKKKIQLIFNLLILSVEHATAKIPICNNLSTWKSCSSTREANSAMGASAFEKFKEYSWSLLMRSEYSENIFSVNLRTAVLTCLSSMQILFQHDSTARFLNATFCFSVSLIIQSRLSITYK